MFFDSENSRLRDELEKKTAALEKWAKDKHAAALVQCVPPTAVWSYHRVLKDIMADLNAALQPEEEDKHE